MDKLTSRTSNPSAVDNFLVYRETFVLVHLHLFRLLTQKYLWASNATRNILLVPASEDPLQMESITETIPTPWFARRLSAQNSFILLDGGYSQNYMADKQRLQISELHFDKIRTPTTFACWKLRFKTEVCACSQSHGSNAVDQKSGDG